MSCRAQMDACGVLCHQEVRPLVTAIKPGGRNADAWRTGVTAMDPSGCHALSFGRQLDVVRCALDERLRQIQGMKQYFQTLMVQ